MQQTPKFEHLKTDFENNTSEHDLIHLDEILELHDYKQTPEIKDRTFYNIEFLYQDFTDPFHLIMMGRKL